MYLEDTFFLLIVSKIIQYCLISVNEVFKKRQFINIFSDIFAFHSFQCLALVSERT